MDRLRLAITKGRLLDSSIIMFEKMGYDCTELKNPGRKLLLSMGNLDVVLAKAPDVLTCVELGACALGIAGKDTILEHGGSFYEVLDLGFGKCRFALAAPAGYDLYPRTKLEGLPQRIRRWLRKRSDKKYGCIYIKLKAALSLSFFGIAEQLLI
jgi:ATP phosphoribosyltransferase